MNTNGPAGFAERLWDRYGSRVDRIDGISGVTFAVWAPNARAVSVVGDFNEWDDCRNAMHLRPEGGVWECFVPGAHEGQRYKYAVVGTSGEPLPLKADPFARYAELRPGTASIVWESHAPPRDDDALRRDRIRRNQYDAPMSIYEAHLGSWRRGDGGRFLTYRELAERLLPYVRDLGFTHVEVLPITEHPYDPSWGYQPTGMFAPTSRFGTPDDFRAFVDRAHELDLGVILDWVPGHFPSDSHGLALFDGTHLYEHPDPRRGTAPDWKTLVYNYGRPEVADFLIASALFWLEEFGIDGIRVDAVASMLYLDYSRNDGEWEPNVHGGKEHLEAVQFLRRLNQTIHAHVPGALTIAEESTLWPKVTGAIADGGLGFDYKWNIGWMHDTLEYFTKRMGPQQDLNASDIGLSYAFDERYVLPFSHDEVVHGKGSLLAKMPGDRQRQLALMRRLIELMFSYPGKKLLFMGAELAQSREWDYDGELDWHLLENAEHAPILKLVRDCNRAYRSQ
jgi:1,4-alpha-glucan branching enzyme